MREKHGEDYSVPQYRIWNHNGQHSSLNEAPPYPIFNGGPKKPPAKRESEALTSCANVITVITGNNPVSTGSVSPGKHAHVSGLYLEQLKRLRALQQSGVLTFEQFEEQKAYTLKNIRKLNK